MERTLVLLKPDAVERRLVGEIVSRFERKGLRVAAMKMLRFDQALARRHYAEHVGKAFYPNLERSSRRGGGGDGAWRRTTWWWRCGR